jgi:hypothetical protein
MPLFVRANVNSVDMGGKLLSYSETILTRPSGLMMEKP